MTRACSVCGGPIPPEKPVSTKTCSPECQKESRRAYLRDYMREDRQRNPQVHQAREKDRAPVHNARRRRAGKEKIIRELHASGMSLRQIARKAGVSLRQVQLAVDRKKRIAVDHDYDERRYAAMRAKRRERERRIEEARALISAKSLGREKSIALLRQAGMSLRAIGREYGISGERVRQLILTHSAD